MAPTDSSGSDRPHPRPAEGLEKLKARMEEQRRKKAAEEQAAPPAEPPPATQAPSPTSPLAGRGVSALRARLQSQAGGGEPATPPPGKPAAPAPFVPRSYATGASPAAASPPAGAGAAPVVAVGAGAGALALTKEAGKQTLWVLGSGLKWVVSTFLGLIIFIAWLEIRSCARDAITGEGEKPVGDADKALVVRAADVARWGCKADQDLERWFKYRDPDGLELTYSFCVDTEGANLDPSWAPALEEAVGCQVEVTVYAADDEAKAKRVYGDYKSVVRDMEEWGAEDGLEVEDRSADFAWGDEHSYSILEGAEGRGAVYVTRKGTRVYRFIAVNAFPQAGSELRTLLEPRFKLLADYDG